MAEDRHRCSGLDRPSPQPPLEILALDVAHGDEEIAVDLAGLVDGQDVGVIDGRRHLRLAQEARLGFRVGAELRGDDLEGDLATEAGLLGKVDDAHTASAEDGLDPIRTELGTDSRIRAHRIPQRADSRA